MRPFELNLGTLLLRYFLMMALIIAGGFTGQYWMVFLGLPVFLSAIMGVRFTRKTPQITARSLPRREERVARQAA